MTRQQLVMIVIGITSIMMPVAFARVLDPTFRDCMRQATDTYQSALVTAQRTYDDELESAMEERKQGHIDSWNNDDDKVQRQVQRDADKRYAGRISAARTVQRDHEREARGIFYDERRMCRSSSSSSSSSRSSSSFSSRSSSSYSSRSFSSSSSRSFSSSSSLAHCNDIVCSDGQRFPSCTPSGAVINYFRDPCSPLPPPPPPPTGQKWCFGDSQCSTGYRCEMGNGICERPCDSPYGPCAAVCAGRCVLSPTW